MTVDVNWLDINTSGQSDSGQLAATGQTGDSATVNLAINATAYAFTPETYEAALTFTNLTSGYVETRAPRGCYQWDAG